MNLFLFLCHTISVFMIFFLNKMDLPSLFMVIAVWDISLKLQWLLPYFTIEVSMHAPC